MNRKMVELMTLWSLKREWKRMIHPMMRREEEDSANLSISLSPFHPHNFFFSLSIQIIEGEWRKQRRVQEQTSWKSWQHFRQFLVTSVWHKCKEGKGLSLLMMTNTLFSFTLHSNDDDDDVLSVLELTSWQWLGIQTSIFFSPLLWQLWLWNTLLHNNSAFSFFFFFLSFLTLVSELSLSLSLSLSELSPTLSYIPFDPQTSPSSGKVLTEFSITFESQEESSSPLASSLSLSLSSPTF